MAISVAQSLALVHISQTILNKSGCLGLSRIGVLSGYQPPIFVLSDTFLGVMPCRQTLMVMGVTAAHMRRQTFLSGRSIQEFYGMSLESGMMSLLVFPFLGCKSFANTVQLTSRTHMGFHERISMNSLHLTFCTNSSKESSKIIW
jgi:hypothetical protein